MTGSADPPFASYAVTAVVGTLILLAALLCFALQSALALCILPLLLFPGGRQRFHHLQSLVWRGVNGVLVCRLNPFWRVQVRWLGEDKNPVRDGLGSIVFCNHRSNADAWFSAAALTSGCIEGRYIYKGSLKKLPVLGCGLVLAGDLAVQFGDKEQVKAMLEQAKEVVRQGYNVFVFPEGTRSPSGILQEFKPSFFRVCAELGCGAIPMVMLGTEKAWPLSGARMGVATVKAAFGEPLYASGPGGAEGLIAAVEARMRAMARELVTSGEEERSEPLITGQPYPWWRPPAALQSLDPEEQLRLLRSGQAHTRGANIL